MAAALRDRVSGYILKAWYPFLSILIAYDIQGIDAEFISLSSIIEGDSNTVLDQPFYDDLAARMAKAIAAAGNKVPVVTGE